METHCFAGFSVSPFYDPMIAKLIVHADSRREAVAKLASALLEFEVEGIATNIPFLRHLIATEEFRRGKLTTDFVPKFMSEATHGR
jgi:acetyl-CoA carboxylase biotin carboxylase subunit